MSDELPPLGPELEGLFDAAKSDVPSAAAKARARAMLGLPTPAVVPPAASTTPAVSTPAVSSGLGLTAVKGLLVLGLLGGAYVVGVRVGDSRAREELAALPPKTVVVEKVVEVRVPAEPVVPSPVAEVVDAGATVPVKAVKKPEAEQPDDLMAELAFVDGARKALAAKDAANALTSLAAYDAKFPRGTMRTDAQLLKLEALLLAGRRSDAEALGKKVTSTTDSELVRERVKRLLDAK
ncbi:MAG: hypothetical protein JNM69_33085 [Archangium sp.]|nr:hypothetical protein [Archangium sp.]